MIELLFRATRRDHPVVIGRTMPNEVSALANLIDPAVARDDINQWGLIASRYPSGRGTQIHALGLRPKFPLRTLSI